MKKLLPFIVGMCLLQNAEAQLLKPFVRNADEKVYASDKGFKNEVSFQWNKEIFEARKFSIPVLSNIPGINSSNALIELPLADGSTQVFYIAAIQVLSDATAQLYPEIKTYDVQAVNSDISGRVTIAPSGMRALLLTKDGRVNIQPADKNDNLNHVVFYSKDQPLTGEVHCGVKDKMEKSNFQDAYGKTTLLFGDCTLRTYNLAVAATGEYTTFTGSQTNAVAAITANVANISLIYEREAAIKFTLVTNNSVIYTNASTDPYPTVSFPTQAILDSNTNALNTHIGASNYDVGIVLNTGWGGGLAYVGGTCNGSLKGGASAGVPGTATGSVLENVAAHEIAHMFSANHTMSAGTGSFCIDNLNMATAYEIGGGSSLMAYAGSVCSGLSYQNNTDAYFHYNSLNAILTYAQSLPTCGVATVLSNNPPVLTVAATSYTIPKSTPFELTVNGSDVNTSDVLKYNFDEYDLATSAMTAPPATTATTGPMFRSYPPHVSNTRIFPALGNVLNNTANTWEVLPSVTRTLNFKAMVRDQALNGGCLAQENIAVNVNNGSGPFEITSNNSAGSYTFGGTPIALTWNVANTTASPVSATNVDILFSTDNGQTFPYTLLSNTPNDGNESITVPNLNTYNGRIKVKASNNIFLDINNAKQTITSSCTANGATFSPDAAVNATVGSAALNLGLAPDYGTSMTVSGNIALTDPSTGLSVINGSGSSCINFSNQFNYDLFNFQVNVAGSYTFTLPGTTPFGTIVNLYENSFDPSNPCNNFITSNGVYGGISISISSSVTASLVPGINYVIAVGSFNSSSSPSYPPSFPSSYSINITAPTGGGIYSGAPNPGASYTYKFVIVNTTTGNITAFSTNGDMTNATNFPAGTYMVYGLSVATSVTATTLNGYIGTSFSSFKTALLNNTVCGNLSSNSKTVVIGVVTALESMKLNARLQMGHVKLTWNVTGEKNMDQYIVEKSKDGSDFQPIGNVMAAHKNNYNFIDDAPFTGNNLYRIKAVDKTQLIQYSNLALVNVAVSTGNTIAVYPNPATDKVTITATDDKVYNCMVTDVSGKIIRKFTFKNKMEMSIKGLASGMYLLQGTNESGKFVTKLFVD